MTDTLRQVLDAFRTKKDDLLPAWLIYPGITLGVIAVSYGLTANAPDFLLNIAADLTVLAGGLFVTNKVVQNWNRRKIIPQLEKYTETILVLLRDLPKVAAAIIRACDQKPEFEQDPMTFSALKKSLAASRATLRQIHETGDNSELKVTMEMLDMRDLQMIERIVNMLSTVHPVPESSIAAGKLAHLYNSRPFETNYYSSYGGIEDKKGVVHTCIGFDQLFAHALTCHVATRISKDFRLLQVYRAQYVHYMLGVASMSIALMHDLESELPEQLSQRIGHLPTY